MEVAKSRSFDTAECNGYTVSTPMSYRGDGSKVFAVRATVNRDVYRAGIQIQNVPSEVSGVDCGDSGFADADGGLMSFVRTFAEVPRPWNEFSSAVYVAPPRYSTRTIPVVYLTDNRGNVTNISDVREESYLVRGPFSSVRPVSIRYEYFHKRIGRTFTKEAFETVETAAALRRGSYRGFRVNIFQRPFTRVRITGTRGCVEGTRVRRWMGEIYETTTAFLA